MRVTLNGKYNLKDDILDLLVIFLFGFMLYTLYKKATTNDYEYLSVIIGSTLLISLIASQRMIARIRSLKGESKEEYISMKDLIKLTDDPNAKKKNRKKQ